MDLEPYLKLLRLIADPSAQLDYEQRVPFANVPAELVCMWFDDLGFSDGRIPDALPAEIREFTSFYDTRVSAIPDSGDVKGLHECSSWMEVVAEARKTLVSLEGHG